MKRILCIAAVTMTLISASGALADEQTVTLAVDNLFCVTCPYIVKQTLARIDGVSAVDVSYQEKTAVVTFDDAKTDVAALTATTASVGFPARVVASQ